MFDVLVLFIVVIFSYAIYLMVDNHRKDKLYNLDGIYTNKDKLTKQEEYFYINLYNTLPVEYNILSKTKIIELIDISKELKSDNVNYADLIKHMSDVTVDFVILDKHMTFCCAIDLRYKGKENSTSNLNPDSKILLNQIRLPLFKYSLQEDYSFNELLLFLENQNRKKQSII